MKNDIKKKKVLHVIHIVYDILSALFILFTSTVLIIYGATRSDEKIQDVLTPNIQDVKQRRNYGYNDEYGIQVTLSYSDIISNYFLTTFVKYITDDYDARISPNEESDYTVTFSNTNAKIYYLNQDYSYPSSAYWLNCDTYYLNKVYVGSLTIDDSEVNRFNYILSIFNGDTKLIEINYKCIVPFLDPFNTSEIGSLQVIVSSYTYVRGGIDVSRLLIRENDNDGFSPFIQYFHKPIYNARFNENNDAYLRGYNYGYSLGEKNGYNTGYEDGKVNGNQSGYTNGYNTGYNEGLVAGAEGIESNAFTVIGQAFDAVGNIFSIEVLPGLPMWILAFAPLIIAVIIVVIKMIKG